MSSGQRGGPPSAAARASASLVLSQGQYRQRLNDCTNALLENFVQIVQSAQVTIKEDDEVSDKTLIAREGFEIDVRSHNIVRAAETLLALIAELKEKILFTDFEALSKDVAKRNSELNACRARSDDRLRALQVEFVAHLHDLETEFYSMRHNAVQSLQ